MVCLKVEQVIHLIEGKIIQNLKLPDYIFKFLVNGKKKLLLNESFCKNISYLQKIQRFDFKIKASVGFLGGSLDEFKAQAHPS